MSPEISVVIPVRNGEEVLARCLKSLAHQSLAPKKYEVIVVNDGSADASARVAQEYGAHLFSQPPSGTSTARNRGVKEAEGTVVLFTDADCVPDRHWVETLSRPLLENQAAGAVGRCCSEQSQWVAALIQIELDERYSKMKKHQEIDFLNTGNCGFRKEVLGEKPFDEDFDWLEDVELSFRLSRLNHKMYFVPSARVSHPHPQNLFQYLRRKFRYATRAFRIYYRYPKKALSDSRTPLSRRLQLLFLGIAILSGIAALSGSISSLVGAGFLVLSSLCSYPVVMSAASRSSRLGLLAPGFILLANMAFILGTVRGVFPAFRKAPPALQCKGSANDRSSTAC